MPYSIVDVSDWPWNRDEQIGSKAKLWVLDPDRRRWLFKERRHDHGEDWSEKAAAEVAELLGINHAVVEIATRQGKAGVISLDFLTARDSPVRLMHGNELLARHELNYPGAGDDVRTNQHTLDRALAVLQQDFITLGVCPIRPGFVSTAIDEFVGYLLLDALIGNTDRHHENWALVVAEATPVGAAPDESELAPTFDHASCLGRELTDSDRTRRLSGQPGQATFESYWNRMPSRWYRFAGDRKPLHPVEVFKSLLRPPVLDYVTDRPQAVSMIDFIARMWIEHLQRTLSDEGINRLIEPIPREIASDPARQFAFRMLQFNRETLVKLLEPT